MSDLLNYLKRKNFAKRLIKLKKQLNNKSVKFMVQESSLELLWIIMICRI